MTRYLGAAIGFCIITAAYCAATVGVLGSLVMAHCPLSDAQFEAGETCTPPADLFFLPVLIVAVIIFGGLQWVFLRWALRRRNQPRS